MILSNSSTHGLAFSPQLLRAALPWAYMGGGHRQSRMQVVWCSAVHWAYRGGATGNADSSHSATRADALTKEAQQHVTSPAPACDCNTQQHAAVQQVAGPKLRQRCPRHVRRHVMLRAEQLMEQHMQRCVAGSNLPVVCRRALFAVCVSLTVPPQAHTDACGDPHRGIDSASTPFKRCGQRRSNLRDAVGAVCDALCALETLWGEPSYCTGASVRTTCTQPPPHTRMDIKNLPSGLSR